MSEVQAQEQDRWEVMKAFQRERFRRDNILKYFPNLDLEYLAEREAEFGRLIYLVSPVRFEDGRSLTVWVFEKFYVLTYENPNNPENERETTIRLSPEMMVATWIAYEVFSDIERDYESLEAAKPVDGLFAAPDKSNV